MYCSGDIPSNRVSPPSTAATMPTQRGTAWCRSDRCDCDRDAGHAGAEPQPRDGADPVSDDGTELRVHRDVRRLEAEMISVVKPVPSSATTEVSSRLQAVTSGSRLPVAVVALKPPAQAGGENQQQDGGDHHREVQGQDLRDEVAEAVGDLLGVAGVGLVVDGVDLAGRLDADDPGQAGGDAGERPGAGGRGQLARMVSSLSRDGVLVPATSGPRTACAGSSRAGSAGAAGSRRRPRAWRGRARRRW